MLSNFCKVALIVIDGKEMKILSGNALVK